MGFCPASNFALRKSLHKATGSSMGKSWKFRSKIRPGGGGAQFSERPLHAYLTFELAADPGSCGLFYMCFPGQV